MDKSKSNGGRGWVDILLITAILVVIAVGAWPAIKDLAGRIVGNQPAVKILPVSPA